MPTDWYGAGDSPYPVDDWRAQDTGDASPYEHLDLEEDVEKDGFGAPPRGRNEDGKMGLDSAVKSRRALLPHEAVLRRLAARPSCMACDGSYDLRQVESSGRGFPAGLLCRQCRQQAFLDRIDEWDEVPGSRDLAFERDEMPEESMARGRFTRGGSVRHLHLDAQVDDDNVCSVCGRPGEMTLFVGDESRQFCRHHGDEWLANGWAEVGGGYGEPGHMPDFYAQLDLGGQRRVRPTPQCDLCECNATASLLGQLNCCEYHRTKDWDDPPCPTCGKVKEKPLRFRSVRLDAFGGPRTEGGTGDEVIHKLTEDPDEEERTSLGIPPDHDLRGARRDWRCSGCRRSFRTASCSCPEMCPACGCRQIRADQGGPDLAGGGYADGSNDESSHTERSYRRWYEDDMHDSEAAQFGDASV